MTHCTVKLTSRWVFPVLYGYRGRTITDRGCQAYGQETHRFDCGPGGHNRTMAEAKRAIDSLDD